MQNTITRRTTLAASVTLPLLPATAYAAPADPTVEAYWAWRAAHEAYEQSLNRLDWPDGCPIVKAAHDQEFAARGVLSDAVATTPAGIAYQVRFAFDVFGELSSADDDMDNPDDFTFENWGDDLERRLLKSMLAGAENMEAVA